MTKFSPGDSAFEKPPPKPASSPGDISMATSDSVPNKKNNEKQKKEIVIRFDFNHFDGTTVSHRVAQVHLHMLHEWQKQYPTLKIYTNNKRKLTTFDLQSWGHKQYEKEFKIHSNNNTYSQKKSYSVLHRVMTNHSLTKLKDSVNSILNQHKC